MIIERTTSENKDFINLVKDLDAYLKITDGDEHSFYNQFNNIDVLKHVVIIYNTEMKKMNSASASSAQVKKPIGCGAIKKFDITTMEIKRMYLSPENRGNSIAQKIVKELEVWAKELGYKKCVLETGKRQPEAVKFYHKCNYKIIPNYGQYKNMENSLCFEKSL